MPNTREKLIELIASKVCDTYSEACEEWLPHDCGKCYANNCHIAEIADHLIADGVVVSKMETATIATDNNVGDKKTPTAKDTNVPSKWIPVTERLPGEHQTVLSINPEYVEYQIGWLANSEEGGVVCVGDGIELYGVTHWMPLPEPPKGE